MHNEENLTPIEKELESVLGQLKPIANTLNCDTLMFNAGRATARNKLPWQMLSGVLTFLLFCSVLNHPDMNRTRNLPLRTEQDDFQVTQISYRPTQVIKAESSGSLEYPMLRDNIVRFGLDALRFQQDMSRSEPQKNLKELLESMLSS